VLLLVRRTDSHAMMCALPCAQDALAIQPAAVRKEGEADEMEEAAAVVSKADADEASRGILGGFIQTFSLIFVAEWGDRSMLATIALGAAQNPVGVFAGAVLGHALATLIAVVGGSLMSERISERTVGLTGGVLFLVFAVATLMGVF
jgi:putative Ca2+/H+ antiporter (TMEM165/GDT1 family)